MLVLGPKTEEVTGGWRKLRIEGLFTGYHYGGRIKEHYDCILECDAV